MIFIFDNLNKYFYYYFFQLVINLKSNSALYSIFKNFIFYIYSFKKNSFNNNSSGILK